MPAQDYTVQDGDCVSSVAFAHGFFWETLWNHPDNAALKSKRKDPNILKPGDVLKIPEMTVKEEACAAESRHKFTLKGVPAKLKLKLMRPKTEEEAPPPASAPSAPGAPSLPGAEAGADDKTSNLADPDYVPPKNLEEPFANAPYVFEIDGVRVDEGQTDGDGCVEIPLVPNARKGRLVINTGKPDEKIIELDLGAMDPVDEPTGARKRLNNLGFRCQPDGPADAEDLKSALRRFQQKHALEITGRLDDATKSKIETVHGC